MRVLRVLSIFLIGVGVLLVAFGCWGMETASGQRRFDEMDGIIPFAAAVVGAVFIVCGAVIGIFWIRKRSA